MSKNQKKREVGARKNSNKEDEGKSIRVINK